MKNIYDFIVIGAGISACTFASFLNNRFSNASILLVEHGRRIGGRSTTRKSRKNKDLVFDHGLPSINFSNQISYDISTLILPLINANKLVDISKDILTINEFGEINNLITNDKIYRGYPFMMSFCEEIINQSSNPKKINFLFETLVTSIKHTSKLWELKINSKTFIKSKNLILSSSLIAHPRCLNILKINSLPLRDALVPGKDEVVDCVIRQISKQQYIKRKVYILYISNVEIARNFKNKNLQIHFSKVINESFNLERIIFQKQLNGSMTIAVHYSYINKALDINNDEIIKCLKKIFSKHEKFIDLFDQARVIDKMDWRASQPINNLLPKELQWSSISNIGFCGDCFDFNGYGGVESAMNSSIRLAKSLYWD